MQMNTENNNLNNMSKQNAVSPLVIILVLGFVFVMELIIVMTNYAIKTDMSVASEEAIVVTDVSCEEAYNEEEGVVGYCFSITLENQGAESGYAYAGMIYEPEYDCCIATPMAGAYKDLKYAWAGVDNKYLIPQGETIVVQEFVPYDVIEDWEELIIKPSYFEEGYEIPMDELP